MKRLAFLFLLLSASVAYAAPPGVINQFNAICNPWFPTQCLEVQADGSIDVNASVSASISGFEPSDDYATLAVTDANDRVALPTGEVVIVQNLGADTVYVNLGDNTAVATTGNIQISAGSWIALTVGTYTHLAAIAATGDTATLTIVGGTGLPTGAIAGAGGGGGGDINVDQWGGVAVTAAAAGADNVDNATVGGFVQTFNMVYDSSTWDRMRGDATNGVLVNLGTNNDVTVTGSVTANAGTDLNTSLLLTTTAFNAAFGTAGSADSQVMSVQGIASMTPLLVGDGTGAFNVIVDSGTLTAVTSITNPVTVTDGAGSLNVIVDSGTLTAVTSITNPVAVTQSGAWSLSANQSVNVAQIAGTTTATSNGGVSAGVQRVTIANDSTGILASIGAISTSVTPGTAAANLGKAEDQAIASADTGVMSLAVQIATPADSAADNDYSPLQMKNGLLFVSPSANTVGGLTMHHAVLGASTNATNVKNAAGQVYSITAFNNSATIAYLKFYNTSSTPTCDSSTVVWTTLIPANTSGAGTVISVPSGLTFSTGISYCATTGIADNDNNAVAASAYVVNIGYK